MRSEWEDAGKWYAGCVGEKGHYYHQSVILPNALRLLSLKKGESLLDLGCGQGVLARHIPKGVHYWGVDSSRALLEEAKRLVPGEDAQFLWADAALKLPLEKRDFDAACFLLSLQNIENPEEAIGHAGEHLKGRGKLLLILNHPCFRIPRQSSWGFDEKAKLQYRRINSYMSSHKIPIETRPGKKEGSSVVHSYHYPLSSYVHFLARFGFAIIALEEWCSDKKSEGAKAKIEDRARREIPLFLALLAEKKIAEERSQCLI